MHFPTVLSVSLCKQEPRSKNDKLFGVKLLCYEILSQCFIINHKSQPEHRKPIPVCDIISSKLCWHVQQDAQHGRKLGRKNFYWYMHWASIFHWNKWPPSQSAISSSYNSSRVKMNVQLHLMWCTFQTCQKDLFLLHHL